MNFDTSVLEYWKQRINSHLSDTYMGVPMLKLPEDLATYEHIMYEAKVNVVVELGTGCGGSAMWFRDRLLAMELAGHVKDTHVITIDLVDRTQGNALTRWNKITRLYGDVSASCQVTNPKPTDRIMVVEDSAHTYNTTYDALANYSDLVSVGSYFVVEDTYIDNPKLRPDGLADDQHGVLFAVNDFLVNDLDNRFKRVDTPYGITTNPGGWLKRVK